MGSKKHLLLLFDRPTEPVVLPKGDNKTVFEVPGHFIPDQYKNVIQIQDRFDGPVVNKVTIQNISTPDLTIPMQLSRRQNFSLLIPKHRIISAKLIDIFMKARDTDELLSLAVYCRDRVNPYLFNYCLSVAILHRTDTTDVPLPNFVETFPDKFMDSGVFSRAREEAATVPIQSRAPIIIPRDFTASDLDPEHRVAYFREDLGINLHHWHWHLVYPFVSSDRSIVVKDRRGELFYYMHHQILGRYNFERLCNNLPRVVKYSDLKKPIPDGYFPKLDQIIASRSWTPRFAKITVSDINRPDDGIQVGISDLEVWISRFKTAIDRGFVRDGNGRQITLTEKSGIDVLGNIIESSMLSPNSDFYGDLHNMGHILIALCHDPDFRYLESFAVMGDTATALRDPVFYQWHAFIEELFLLHKNKLPRYTVDKLSFPGVSITEVKVTTENNQVNKLQTFWQQTDMDLSRGLDFSPRSSVLVRFSHLQHRPFTYRIVVNNDSQSSLMGTVRIFIAPRFDERGVLLQFNDQRLLMVELDKFKTPLVPGRNEITRKSSESSVTIPYERTFRNLDSNRPTDDSQLRTFEFCGCGWPQHMLIPKGTTKGLVSDLFVMVSNNAQDRINQSISDICNDADSYCGIRDRLYPDTQSMGYPFDRVGRSGVTILSDFLTPNMKVLQVTINHNNITELRTGENVTRTLEDTDPETGPSTVAV